mgnify:CR=1 FL=1
MLPFAISNTIYKDESQVVRMFMHKFSKFANTTWLFKGDYLLVMERIPIKDVDIKVLLQTALTYKTNDRMIYMKGIDAS